jgi:hypothetical protein
VYVMRKAISSKTIAIREAVVLWGGGVGFDILLANAANLVIQGATVWSTE